MNKICGPEAEVAAELAICFVSLEVVASVAAPSPPAFTSHWNRKVSGQQYKPVLGIPNYSLSVHEATSSAPAGELCHLRVPICSLGVVLCMTLL